MGGAGVPSCAVGASGRAELLRVAHGWGMGAIAVGEWQGNSNESCRRVRAASRAECHGVAICRFLELPCDSLLTGDCPLSYNSATLSKMPLQLRLEPVGNLVRRHPLLQFLQLIPLSLEINFD